VANGGVGMTLSSPAMAVGFGCGRASMLLKDLERVLIPDGGLMRDGGNS
jgi:hypothetical protein